MAHGGMDPLEFRLKNLNDAGCRKYSTPRLKSSDGASRSPQPERGFGIAGGVDKGGYVATCAEVEIDPATKHVRIRRVVQAWDCGAVVNPDGLRNQLAGPLFRASAAHFSRESSLPMAAF